MCEKIICSNLRSFGVSTVSFMHLVDLLMILSGLDPFVIELIPEGHLRPESSRKGSHRTEVKSVYHQPDDRHEAADENRHSKTERIQNCHS